MISYHKHYSKRRLRTIQNVFEALTLPELHLSNTTSVLLIKRMGCHSSQLVRTMGPINICNMKVYPFCHVRFPPLTWERK